MNEQPSQPTNMDNNADADNKQKKQVQDNHGENHKNLEE